MRRAALLVLFVLPAAAMVFAQTPAGTGNNPSTNSQTQIPPSKPATAAPGTAEDSQKSAPQPQTGVAPGNQNAPPSSGPTPTPAPSAPEGGMTDQVAAGAEIRATLDTPLSTRTSKPGDRFTATIAVPAHGSNGGIVIPPGARLEGELAEPEEEKTLAALRDKAVLSLRFRDLVLPGGQTLPLSATLISVNDTNPRTAKKSDEEGPTQSGSRNVAKDAGIGQEAGTPVFGSPLKGLAIGAMSGGGYVVSTKGKDVRLPAQTGMVIRLDQPVSAGISTAPPR